MLIQRDTYTRRDSKHFGEVMRIKYTKVTCSILFCCVSGLAMTSDQQLCTTPIQMAIDNANRSISETSTTKCAAVLPLTQRFRMAKAVFAGRVVEIKPESEIEVVKFRVSKKWKNVSRDELVLYNAVDGEAIMDYRIGETYIVFAWGTDERLSTGSCSQGDVLLYAQAKSEIGRLNRLAKQRVSN